MKPLPLLLSAASLAGCAAQVTHPTKSVAEMQIDIDRCSSDAKRKYWMDPVAALLNAYDCLEARGYQRGHPDVAAKVERAVAVPPPRNKDALPCRVPCRAER